MLKVFLALLIAAGFLLIGILCLFRPEKVRDYLVGSAARGTSSVKSYDLSFLLKFYQPLLPYRIFGVLCIGAFLLILYTMLASRRVIIHLPGLKQDLGCVAGLLYYSLCSGCGVLCALAA